jgi:organic radical activating enzyme
MKFKISEIFYSAQGEGRYVGVPSIFLRTFGCNFKCEGFGCAPGERNEERGKILELVRANPDQYKTFNDLPLTKTGCDSYASWDPAFKDFSHSMDNDTIISRMYNLLPEGQWKSKNGNNVHLVITGGEPLLGWQRNYPDLLDHQLMLDLANVTFETNGTQKLSEDFHNWIQDWHADPNFIEEHLGEFREMTFSVSPKLSVSGEKWADAIKPDVIKQYQEVGVTYLKFVVDKIEDFAEVDQAVSEYRAAGFMGSVYVMPVGGTLEGYNQNRVHVADAALERGYYYSPRLHVDLWGNGWGK